MPSDRSHPDPSQPDDPQKSLAERLCAIHGQDLDSGVSLGDGASVRVGPTPGVDDQPSAGSGPKSKLFERLRAEGPRGTRYTLLSEVGRGGMGVVLEVWDAELRRKLAMKVIRERVGKGAAEAMLAPQGDAPPKVDSLILGRFLEEAQITGQLDHPGIVPVHELGLDSSGRVYFTMRLVRGEELYKVFGHVLTGHDGWNQVRALNVLLRVCEAVAYAHSKQVIHRDLKPANVMVGRFGEVVVMDWGLARVLGREDKHDLRLQKTTQSRLSLVRTERHESSSDSPDSPLMTMDGDILGTPSFMPPEQARGELELLGPHSDVYSIGAMLYRLLTGTDPYVPFGAPVSDSLLLMALLHGPPPSVESLAPRTPPELVAICEKAMARDIALRYPTTETLAADLRAYIEHRVVAAYETGTWAETRKWVQRNKALAGSLAAAVFAIVMGLVGFGLKTREANAAAQRADNSAKIAENEKQRATELRDAAVARADALWSIQELSEFRREANEIEFAWALQSPGVDWWLETARGLVDGQARDDATGRPRRPGLVDHQRLLVEVRESGSFRPIEFDEESRRNRLHELCLQRVTAEMQALESPRSLKDIATFGQYALQHLTSAWDSFERSPEAAIELQVSRPMGLQFEDREKYWWNEQLTKLESDLVELQRQVAVAERCASSEEARRLWAEATAAIREHQEYGGRELGPQLFLLPLGPDPETELWEFAHLLTGEPAVRGADGKLVMRDETGLVFVLLPGGRVPVEVGKDSGPWNNVDLEPFFLSKYEMTRAQWQRISMGWNGRCCDYEDVSPIHPADRISWDDCQQFLGRLPGWIGLPSEAQWEYGCRGATTTPWWTGADEVSLAGSAHIASEGIGHPAAIGTLLANPLGLHDVHGNLWEWCQDAYTIVKDEVRPRLRDGLHDVTGAPDRVCRGGGFAYGANSAHSSVRAAFASGMRYYDFGLRPRQGITP